MKRSKILLVDDEPSILKLCAKVLRGEGFDVTTATDGAMGLDAYRREYADIGLIVSDVTMPGMDGVEMVREIASTDPHVRALLISGRRAPDGLPAQVCDVLEKPFHTRQLIDAVQKCLIAGASEPEVAWG